MEGQAVVGDGAHSAAVNLARPGAARVNEVWLGLRDPTRDGGRPRPGREAVPRARNRVASGARGRCEARPDRPRDPDRARRRCGRCSPACARRDPVDGVGDLRDERGELFDLEAQGASPSLLRRIVRLRALRRRRRSGRRVRSPGSLSRAVVTDLVGLTARATAAEPPLVLAVDVLAILGAAPRYVVIAGGARRGSRRGAHSAARGARRRGRGERTRRDPGCLPRLRLGGGRRRRAAGADDDRAAGRAVRRPRAERLGKSTLLRIVAGSTGRLRAP